LEGIKIKIGLIHAPNPTFISNQNFGLKFSPVWAYVLIPYLRKYGHVGELFDLTVVSNSSISHCDVYFLSGINQDLDSLREISQFLRSNFPTSRQFLGGPIAWSFDQAGELIKLNFVDTICIGDGEVLINQIFSLHSSNSQFPSVIRAEDRFDLNLAKPMDLDVINSTFKHYYGAVVEVSRGCPFLCEFCDIRVMKDNNRSRVKEVNIIIEELNYYRRNGVRNIQLACDNFIGDLSWAKALVRAIIINNEKNNWSPSFYTWLTINISFHDQLMKDMRIAGFDNLFIGVESFENNTLLETAKLQNSKVCIEDELIKIQSYGFIVVAGLIFGFDSDTEMSADSTLKGIEKSGLLSGDASLLTALPGTPLYRRMKLSNRLRDFKNESFLGGYKYVTNIKYLLDKKIVVGNYIKFSRNFISGSYQYKRLNRFFVSLAASKNYIQTNGTGYTDPLSLFKKIVNEPKIILFYLKIMLPLIFTKDVIYLLKALCISLKYKFNNNIDFKYFIFWLFIWANAVNKYGELSENDFDIDSVPKDFDYSNLIPEGYKENPLEEIPRNKIQAQLKSTTLQLERIIKLHGTKI
jgi:radical SAM superfamily enzyme YgiQ (UPF0313 family)